MLIKRRFLPGYIRTFKYRDVLWRLPQLQIVRVSQLHLVIPVPAQQLVHGVFRKALWHRHPFGEDRAFQRRSLSKQAATHRDAVVIETLEVPLLRNALSNN